ncbi:winged helix-turn-helix domain-containing protein [Paenibacillus polymyxa]|nr:winged helix-turn-helix domain-containing protein [Paenibacillus polymyxa]OBA03527.1 hypothetical protein A9P44_05380 [Paenibacillus polymyxa]
MKEYLQTNDKLTFLGHSIYFCSCGSYIQKNNKKIFLSTTENLLLSFFCENPNKKVYVQDLVELLSMTKPNIAFTEQNVYVYISRLRKKLEDIPSQPCLLLNLRPGYLLSI